MGASRRARAGLLAVAFVCAAGASAAAQNRVNLGTRSIELPAGWAGAPSGERGVNLNRPGGKRIVIYARALPSFLNCATGMPETKPGSRVRRYVPYLARDYDERAIEAPTLSGGFEAFVCADLSQGVLAVQIIWKDDQKPYDETEVAALLASLRDAGGTVGLPERDSLELPGIPNARIEINSDQGAWSVAKVDQRWVLRRDWPSSSAINVRILRARLIPDCARKGSDDPTMRRARAGVLVPDGWDEYVYETVLSSPSTGQAYGWMGRVCRRLGSGVLIAHIDNIGVGVGRPSGRDAQQVKYILTQAAESVGGSDSSSSGGGSGSGGGGGGGSGGGSSRWDGRLPRLRIIGGVQQLKGTFAPAGMPTPVGPPDATLGGLLHVEYDRIMLDDRKMNHRAGMGYLFFANLGYDPEAKLLLDLRAHSTIYFPPSFKENSKFVFGFHLGFGFDGIGAFSDQEVGKLHLDSAWNWDYGVRLHYWIGPLKRFEASVTKVSRFKDDFDEVLRAHLRFQMWTRKGRELNLGVYFVDYYDYAEMLSGAIGFSL